MSIGTVCSDKVFTISENASIQECAKLMSEKQVVCVLVCKNKTDDKKPIGLITDRDIVVKLVSKSTDLSKSIVSEIMSTDLLVLPSNEKIDKAIKAMRTKGVRRAPVIYSNKNVCGIVTVDDLMIMLSNEFHELSELVKSQISGHK